MNNKTAIRPLLHLILVMAITALPAFAEKGKSSKETTRELRESLEREQALEKQLALEKEIKATFGYSFNDISGKIVTITTENGSGSGFIATMEGKTYLFTNQHVILGADTISFKTASGVALQPRRVELSATRDIARLELADEVNGFEITGQIVLDSSIGVYGNSEGGGVATELYGKVTGLGADVVEVSADFVPGNSGSPVLDLDQKVIGIASYVKYNSDDDGKKNIRRFCYRLTDDRWMPVQWKHYNKKYGTFFCDSEQLVDSIVSIAQDWYDAPYSRMTADDHPDSELRKWSTEHNRMINRIMRLNDKGSCSQHELDNTNKQIKKDMMDSADTLSSVCKTRARQMRMLSEQNDLTAFLRDTFTDLADQLDRCAYNINLYGIALSKTDYFSFK